MATALVGTPEPPVCNPPGGCSLQGHMYAEFTIALLFITTEKPSGTKFGTAACRTSGVLLHLTKEGPIEGHLQPLDLAAEFNAFQSIQ